jgi:hypothetical protein
LSPTFDDLGRLNGLHIFADSVLDSLISSGIFSTGCNRTSPKISSPESSVRYCRAGFTRPYEKFSTTLVATLAGQQENLL